MRHLGPSFFSRITFPKVQRDCSKADLPPGSTLNSPATLSLLCYCLRLRSLTLVSGHPQTPSLAIPLLSLTVTLTLTSRLSLSRRSRLTRSLSTLCLCHSRLRSLRLTVSVSHCRLLNVGLESTMTQPTVILATASYDHTIRFWEAKSGRCYRTIQYPDSQVNRLEITPDKRYLAAAGNPHIRLFDVNSNTTQPVMSYDSHTNNVMAVGFQCDGNWMYSGSEDGTVKIWDLRAPGCQREYESRAAVNTVVLHPNQTELISGDQNGNIRVWDLTANSCSCELVPEVDTAVRSLTVMWDGTLVVAANNHGTCYVWRLQRGTQTMTNFEPLHKLQAHKGYILKCLLSPEFCDPHRYLATASSDHTVKIWNVDGFTLEKTLIGHQRWVWDCVFSVDGAYLITASSDTTARLWSMSTGEDIRVYQGHHKATICCALHDGAEPTAS